MGGFFDRLFGRHKQSSSSIVKQRLQLVLVHDRSNLSEQALQDMKDEIIEVISKYVKIDRTNVGISLEQRDRENWLVADIPLVPLRAEAEEA